MPLHCLARIRPLHKATGTRIDIHVSSASLRQITGLNGVVWEPAMVAAPVLNMRLFNGDFQAAVEPGSASLPINMTALKQSYPTADACAWSAAPVDIWAGEAGQAWPWTQVFSGKVSGWNRRGQVLSLSAETAFDDKNVLTGTYAGTGGAEGSLDLKGKVKPLALGWPQNVEPVLINAVDSVYQFSAYGPIEAVTKLYERGSDFGAAIGDYADYAALVAATIPPGRWATCLAQGMIRLGAPAFGVITGDLKGHKVGASAPRLTGAIINALATISGTSSAFIESASLTALDAAAPYPVSAMITDQVKFSDAAKGLALPCNWQAGISLLGKFFVMPVTLAGSPALTLDSRGRSLPQVIESAEQDVSPPYFKTILGAAQSWRVHTADEISFTASLILRGEYVPGEAYREGHIVTSADGSAWLYVNPVASSGNAPPSWPTTSNAYWENHTPPLSSAALKYGDGTPIESLKPAQVGATVGAISGVNLRNNADTAYLGDLDIITAAGTAAAIAGQGPGATAVAGAVMNYAVGLGQNVLTNSAFENGSYGWEPGWDDYASFTPEHGVGLPGYSGALSTAYTRVLGTPPAGVFDSYTPSGGNPKRWWLPVSGDDRVFASALVAYHRLAYAPDLKVGWYDASGVYLTESFVATGGRNGGAVNGEPANFDRVGGFVLAPANARYARIWIRGTTDGGQTDPYLFYTQMMLCRVPADQTAWPVYHDGGADLFANVTGENTAAAIAGQGPLATAPSASPYVNANISIGANGALIGAGGGSVTIGGLGYLGDLDATRGARAGINLRNNADTAYLGDGDIVTGLGTAAAINGQGYFATQNYADWDTRVTGTGKPQNNATVGARVGVNLRNSADTAYLGDADVVTAAGTAAAIAGQSAWATYSGLAPNAVVRPGANLIYDAGLALQGQGWDLYGWSWGGNGPDIGFYVVTTQPGANMRVGERMSIYGGYAYTFSIYSGGSDFAESGAMQLNFYDASDNLLSQAVAAGTPQNVGYQRTSVTATAPANASYARTYLSAPAALTGYFVAFRPKLEMGSSATIWDNDATFGARYQTGGNIDSLKPAEAGANVTEIRTAAAFTGQSAWATYSGLAPSNVAGQIQHLQTDGNIQSLHVYKPGVAFLNDVWPAEAGANVTESRTAAAIANQGSLATLNSVGSAQIAASFGANLAPHCNAGWAPPESFFVSGWNPDNLTGVNIVSAQKGTMGYEWSLNPDESSWGIHQSNATRGSLNIHDFYFKWLHDVNNIENYQQSFSVVPGQRIEFSIYAGNHRSDPCSVGFVFFDAVGNQLSYTLSGNTIGTDEASGGNNLSGYKRIWARGVAPVGAISCMPYVRKGTTASGQSDSWLFLAKPMICIIPDGQTELSPWTPGGGTGIPVYSSGQTFNQLKPGEAGANITENRIAAAISGQGPFATTPLPVSRLTMIKPNLFPYPFGVDDGRNAAQIGWSNTASTAGFSEFGMGRNAYFDGGYYQTNRSSGAAATLYPYYDMAWDGGSAAVSVGLNGYSVNGTFNPYVEFINAAKSAVLGGFALTYNTSTERFEANGVTTPDGTAFIRVVVSSSFSATSGTYQDIVCWGIKVERGPNATPLMDTPRQRVSGDQVEWATGGKLNALRPAEFGSNVTENRTAAAIAGQGYFATQNYAGISRLLVAGYDNIIPDGDYRDPVWWGFSGLPNVGFLAMDSYWEQNRSISFTCDRDFDFSSAYFNIEPGSVYRVRTRIWNNDAGAGWTGDFWPLIHMPNVAWWSLKHGAPVNSDVGGSDNAISAIGDTGVQEFYFRATSNTMRNIQFRFKSTARGSRVDLQVMISKVPQLGKDLIKSGTATKYLVSEIETGLGTAAAIAGQGAGATANNLAQLDATAAAQLTTAYNGGVQSAAYGETIKRKIGPSGTLDLSALVNCDAGGVSGSIRARIESRPYGGSWSTVATGAGSATGPSEPGGDSTSGTFTNSTGVEQVFEFRVIEVRTPSGAGGSILASQSYVTG